MLRPFIRFQLVTLLISFSMLSFAQKEIKVMSYNIRLDVKSDGENQWDKRKEKVTGLMNYYEADFIGGQEVQHHQLQYLLQNLNGYSYIGAGRDDGKEAGEYSCIFYKSYKYTVIQQNTFWLSATPDTVSMGWDAVCNRVCTYGLFRNKKTKQYCWVFNTHFDHIGVTARELSAKLIVERIAALNKDKNYPVIMTGDFNSTQAEKPAAYISAALHNARTVSEQSPYGPVNTWNAFQFDRVPDKCIDYIFIKKDDRLKVKKFTTITDSYDKKYPSDHFPILATLVLNK